MLEGEALAAAYASADAFVFPSDTDTFGNVVLEAQASGLPVIVSDAGGPRENVEPGVTGMVIPAGDRGALVEAMGALAADGELRRRMGAAGRAAMLERSCEEAYERTWRIYEEMEAAGPSDETEPAWPGAGMDLSAALAPDSRSMTSAAIS
jgi:glycosyltransferase involved in cell wall biosynthesis